MEKFARKSIASSKNAIGYNNSMKIKTLIHTALVAEAKPIIGHFKLTCTSKQPYNLYEKENVVLIVSGMGSILAREALMHALKHYTPEVAMNIGIAGCVDKTIPKGKLFCTTHQNLAIPFASLSSHKNAIHDDSPITTTLVDMEAECFLQTMPKTIETYVFKVVSDHLETALPSKGDVGNWIGKSIKEWEKYVRF